MQNSDQRYYVDRMIYYASRGIVEQGQTGEDWKYQYSPVYTISFMNFVSSNLEHKFRIDAAICDLANGKPISNKQRYIFIQLPLFDKHSPEECLEEIDMWYYVFINMSTMNTMPFTQQKRLSPDLFNGFCR